tara:strand:+ start:3296 stop:4102 length:807 start_codon:yes stop_codon:yes gene_type:complete
MPSAVRLFPAVALMALLAACQDPTPEPVTPPTPTQSPTRATPVPVSEGIAEEYRALAETLTEIMGVAPDAIGPAAAEGMLQVRWGTNFAYLPEGGSHVVFGDMIDLRTGEQITEASRKAMRLAALARVEDSIEFLPKSPRHVVTVFTDIDCGYCRKMHSELADYLAEDIGIRYVFYPRSGPGTESFRKAEAVWCSSDRKKALTEAKQGAAMKGDSSCANPVLADYQLGQELGLRGTPMIVLPDGEIINGYVPAASLAAQLATADQAEG